MNTVLAITGALLVIIPFICLIYDDTNKEKKKYKKGVEELKVGNRYKMKKSSLFLDDNPFIDETYIVEIIDIKVNNKNKLYVQYKQIEPEYKDELFSGKFEEFIDYYELIK